MSRLTDRILFMVAGVLAAQGRVLPCAVVIVVALVAGWILVPPRDSGPHDASGDPKRDGRTP